MRISSNNLVPSATITVTADDSGQDQDNVKSFDFSTNYAGAGSVGTMVFSIVLPSAQDLSYVAIAGHTLVGSVEVKIDTVSVGTYTLSDNRKSCLFFNFTEQSGTTIEITFDKLGATSTVMLVTHIAAGISFNVPNSGEQSGYQRLWLTASKKQEITLNAAAAPVSIINKSIAPKATLSIPNMPRAIAEGAYRDLTDYLISTAFFILERDDSPNSSYLCFDTKLKTPKAHSKTRELVNVSFSFNAFTGV